MKRLKILNLSYNDFTCGIPPKIGKLKKLKVLYLTDCNLTGRILKEIGSLQNLVLLYIYDNKFTFEVLEKSVRYIKTSLWSKNGFDYSKQSKVKTSKTYTDGKIVLNAVMPGKKNTYQRYKNGKLIKEETKTKYFINNPGKEADNYVCKIKNSAVPKLVLETYEIRINNQP